MPVSCPSGTTGPGWKRTATGFFSAIMKGKLNGNHHWCGNGAHQLPRWILRTGGRDMKKKVGDLHVLIITGLSGAGKTQVANYLEDMGYYCVDNLPPLLITTFIELSSQAEGTINKIALVIDVRGGEFFKDLSAALQQLLAKKIAYEILFLEASQECLVRRFKETRRLHPVDPGEGLLASIEKEKNMLAELRGQAHIIIDTSNLLTRDLKEKLMHLYDHNHSGNFYVNLLTFGYKKGIPVDADIVMDVRFIPNPFYQPELKHKTGNDPGVRDYVLGSPLSKSFARRFLNLLKFLIPNYIAEGKNNLVVAIGCTGGQHRSVALGNYVGDKLKKMGFYVRVRHRDISE